MSGSLSGRASTLTDQVSRYVQTNALECLCCAGVLSTCGEYNIQRLKTSTNGDVEWRASQQRAVTTTRVSILQGCRPLNNKLRSIALHRHHHLRYFGRNTAEYPPKYSYRTAELLQFYFFLVKNLRGGCISGYPPWTSALFTSSASEAGNAEM